MLKYRQVNGNPESSLGSENGSLTTLSIFRPNKQTNKKIGKEACS